VEYAYHRQMYAIVRATPTKRILTPIRLIAIRRPATIQTAILISSLTQIHHSSLHSHSRPHSHPLSHRTMSSSASSQQSTQTMRAVVCREAGDPCVMALDSVPRPNVGARELLIRVSATSLNRADTLQRRGKYPPPPGASTIMGLECSGIVEQVGPQCSRGIKVGDKIMALLSGGGYAEYVSVDEGSVMPIPSRLTLLQAAAIPEVYLTAYLIARQLGGMKAGDIILVHAAASGVGTALLQLASLFGAKAIATCSAHKADYCKQHGAVACIDYKSEQQWGERVKEVCKQQFGRDGVDLILDPVGASHAVENVKALAMDGRWILYGTMGGVEVEKFPLGQILRKRARLEGSTLRSRDLDFKARLVSNFQRECFDAIERAQIDPVIHKEFEWEDVRQAHEMMESNANMGKIVMRIRKDE